MAYDYLEVNHLDVYNTFTGGGILFPKAFTEPGGGVLSAYKGHFGQGSSAIPYSASLVSGPSVGAIPTPLSWNFLGLGVETGVRNQLGVDIKIGADISLGALKATYSAFFNKVTGKEVAINPADSTVAPVETHVSALGSLLGSWNYNGLSLSLLHTHSDERLKKNIQSSTIGLNFIKELRPITYQWKPNNEIPTDMMGYAETNYKNTDKVIHGFIAQEVKAAIDNHGDENFSGWELDKVDGKTQRVKKEMFIMPIVKAIQELSAKIDTLETEMTALKARVTTLEG